MEGPDHSLLKRFIIFCHSYIGVLSLLFYPTYLFTPQALVALIGYAGFLHKTNEGLILFINTMISARVAPISVLLPIVNRADDSLLKVECYCTVWHCYSSLFSKLQYFKQST